MFLTESMIKRSSVKINQKTSNQHSLSLFWNSSWVQYLIWSTTISDEDRPSITLYEYCADVWDYLVFLTLWNDTDTDYLNVMYNKIEKSTWIITYIQAIDVWDVSSSGIANVKNYNWHLYVNFSYSWTYYYYDMDIAAGTGSRSNWTYTNWVDIDNTPINYQWYKFRTSTNKVRVGGDDYVKNKIRVDYE